MGEFYSAVTWTVAELLADVRREARIPDAEYTDAEILREANNAIWTDIQRVLVADQGVGAWGVTYDDLTVAADGLGANSDTFLLPSFASAEGLLNVQWFSSASDDTPKRLSPIPVQQEDDYRAEYGTNTGSPNFYTIEAGRLRLLPVPTSGGRVRIWYQARHPELVATTDNVVAVDSVVTSGTEQIDFQTTRPSNWPTLEEGGDDIAIDLFSSFGPHRYYFRRLLLDGTDSPDGSSAYIDSTLSTEDIALLDSASVAANSGNGDVYAALHGQSDVVMLPLEYRKALSQKVASYVLRQIGDEAGANSMEGMSARSLASAHDQFLPRTSGQAQRWVNRRSPLRSSGRRNRWR